MDPTTTSDPTEASPLRVSLSAKAVRNAQKGRAWFFADDLEGVPEDGLQDGRFAIVRGPKGETFGVGLLAAGARIRLRLFGGNAPAGAAARDPEAFLRQRLDGAIARRETASSEEPRGVRLVHAEADGLPGLVVDRYGDVLVLQISAAGMEAHRSLLSRHLVDRLAPRAVVARQDLAVRELEGLSRGDAEWLHGDPVDEVEIVEHGVRHVVRPVDGHKTGFYLDQRNAREYVQRIAKGRRVLDLFSYQGGFALAALSGGASSVLAVDQSEPALRRAETGATQNGFEGLRTQCGNAFDVLRALRDAGETFDLIVVDPPPFAKSKRERGGGARGYRDLNRNALRLLAPDGLLVTCSCSHHVTPSMFEDLLRQAAAGLRFRATLRRRLMAGDDHPAAITLPESEYLKSCVVQRIDLDHVATAEGEASR